MDGGEWAPGVTARLDAELVRSRFLRVPVPVPGANAERVEPDLRAEESDFPARVA